MGLSGDFGKLGKLIRQMDQLGSRKPELLRDLAADEPAASAVDGGVVPLHRSGAHRDQARINQAPWKDRTPSMAAWTDNGNCIVDSWAGNRRDGVVALSRFLSPVGP